MGRYGPHPYGSEANCVQTLSTAFRSINRLQPEQSYNTETLSHFFRTADVLSAHPNCLGLLIGNEIVNDYRSVRALPVMRAAVRDVKKYLKLKNNRTGQRIPPVGYSSADVKMVERDIRDYLSAGDRADRIDFWSVSRDTKSECKMWS